LDEAGDTFRVLGGSGSCFSVPGAAGSTTARAAELTSKR
jgi:hypothetical protein